MPNQLTYGDEAESFQSATGATDILITFTSPVFGFVIYAKTTGIRYEINGATDGNSMELPAGQRETRAVLTETIAVRSLAGAGAVFVSGHR